MNEQGTKHRRCHDVPNLTIANRENAYEPGDDPPKVLSSKINTKLLTLFHPTRVKL